MLPDGKSVLFSLIRFSTDDRILASEVAVQSLKSGERKVLLEGAQYPQYLRTGYILFASDNELMVVPFDPDKLELTGEKVSTAEKVHRIGRFPQFAVSDSGTLVYVPEEADSSAYDQRSLVWVDRNGKETPLAALPDAYAGPRISPDETQLAATIMSGRDAGSIWILDLIRSTRTRLTFHKGMDFNPLWTPDGKQVAYVSFREAGYVLNRRAANGTGKEESIASGYILPFSWSKDGKTMILERIVSLDPPTGDIGTLSIEGGREYKPLLQEKHSERQPYISPDGRWMAYVSDESGQEQIYVHPFPDVDKDKRTISTDGGNSPLWSPDGHELFYRNGDAVMAVPVKTDPGFASGELPGCFFGVLMLGLAPRVD